MAPPLKTYQMKDVRKCFYHKSGVQYTKAFPSLLSIMFSDWTRPQENKTCFSLLRREVVLQINSEYS